MLYESNDSKYKLYMSICCKYKRYFEIKIKKIKILVYVLRDTSSSIIAMYLCNGTSYWRILCINFFS